MNNSIITPEEAQAFVEQRIEQFGLGALPSVTVAARPDGHWRVTWENEERYVAPLSEAQWAEWLEQNIGPVGSERLQTTEG